ncbi:MAG: hypothetical protein KC502_16350 [Myxococcales bacterium]|nr:hypothetical protein [Myxococcales bacterium]
MSMYETAINYVRQLARPRPSPLSFVTVGGPDADFRPPRSRRSKIRRAAKRAHRRVVTRLKQPKRQAH